MPKPFYYLEYGLLMFRQIGMLKRMTYHYHIVTREDDELIKKVSMKQKEMQIKGYWIETIKKEYDFIGEDLEAIEICIKSTFKGIFIHNMKRKIYNAAFRSYLDMKISFKKKMHKRNYAELRMQTYHQFNSEEKRVLFSLRLIWRKSSL